MKNHLKLLIAEDCEEFSQKDIAVFEEFGFEIIISAKDGLHLLGLIEKYSPNIVVMDLFMPKVDAIGVINSVKKSGKLPLPMFVVLSNFDNAILEKDVLAAGASYFALKPFNIRDLAKQINHMASRKPYLESNEVPLRLDKEISIEVKVTDILHQIGVPAHIKGYHYLRDSIIISVQNPEIINAVTKQLYPSVAQRFTTTSSRVERAIRHAIEVAWDRGDVDVLNSYFGYTIHNSRGKPTNSEFIAMISDKLRLQIKSCRLKV
ncbi:MAG: sporulation transcription factor Spo0A [Oscillospiraceae bacterium]|nr:sporulation transcription factor Spo0A [Oscillospiraceae bacterium]